MNAQPPNPNIEKRRATRKPSADGLMSVAEVADYLNVGRSTVYTLTIPVVRIGRRRLYRRQDVDAFAVSRRFPSLPDGGAR